MWRGDSVKQKMQEAAKLGVDQTLAECVNRAKRDHPWQNVTGTAEGSIRMEPAQVTLLGRVRGLWGSFQVDYFIFLELGTQYMAALPILRPTADTEYPKLAGRIADNFNG